MLDKFDKRLNQYYEELGRNRIEKNRLRPDEDKVLIEQSEKHEKSLCKSIVEGQNLYDNFLQKLDEIMPEI